MNDRGDHELLTAAVRDPEAFGALARRHLPRLRAWACARTRDLATANDVAAETMARAWLHRRRYRGSCDGEARGWLLGIARNVIREWSRERQVHDRALRKLGVSIPPPVDDAQELTARLAATERGADLWPLVDDLPPAQREALRLRILEQRSYGETADQLGRTPVATRLLVSRALRRLRAATGA